MNMRRAPGVVMVAPWIGAGLDRDEPVIAIGIGSRAASTSEIRIERRRVLVNDVDVTAAGIGLPDFQQRIGHRAAVFVPYMAVDDDAFAQWLAGMLDGEVVIVLAHRLVAVNWPGQ